MYSIGPGGIWVFAPTGALLERLEVPEKASNLAFGDADFKTLYIPASTSVYSMRVSVPGMPPGRAEVGMRRLSMSVLHGQAIMTEFDRLGRGRGSCHETFRAEER